MTGGLFFSGQLLGRLGFPLHLDYVHASRYQNNTAGTELSWQAQAKMDLSGRTVLLLDDILDEQDAISDTAMENTWAWYESGPRQRLQPGGSIVVVMTRWSKRDLTGQIINNSIKREGDEWEVIEFPAILPSEKPLWPEFWQLEELEKVKRDVPNSKWQAQYQQNHHSDQNHSYQT